MTYKHIIFDIDGTMIDTEAAALRSLRDAVHAITGEWRTTDSLRFAFGIPGEETMRRLGVSDTRAGLDEWLTRFSAEFCNVKVYDGIPELLHTLFARGYRLGIVTSKLRDEYTRDFLQFGLGEMFSTVVCCDECAAPKPSPAPLERYMQLTGASPREILYVGDMIYDAECAHSAGVDFGLALWGASKRVPSEYYFAVPSDVLSVVEGV